MRSHLSGDFIARFRRLPSRIQRVARRNYKVWKENPWHPGLQFKLVGKRRLVYSVRVGIGWRAMGVKVDGAIVWFWIGSHAEYERLVSEM
ncbi:MAG: hypothetical protein FJ279_34510 [Planctomycetes bacterium]|nr:hypothetical protein [Planctomycetota bacterium]MBM4079519.1 hypothetical protein [Planctomycetota bacterium]